MESEALYHLQHQVDRDRWMAQADLDGPRCESSAYLFLGSAMPDDMPHDLAADKQLVADLLLGVPGAAERFYVRFDPMIRAVASRRLVHPQRADAVQEVYAKLCAGNWLVLQCWRKEGNLASFIAKVAKNTCIDVHNRIHKQKRREQPMDPNSPDVPDDDPAIDPEAVIYAVQLRECLERAVDALSEPHARIIRLRHFEELRHAEIAARLDRTIGYVGGTLWQAERKLRDKIREHCADHLGLFARVLE